MHGKSHKSHSGGRDEGLESRLAKVRRKKKIAGWIVVIGTVSMIGVPIAFFAGFFWFSYREECHRLEALHYR